jgi:hypothetical protein
MTEKNKGLNRREFIGLGAAGAAALAIGQRRSRPHPNGGAH